MNVDALIKSADLQKVSQEGMRIYETLKSQFEPVQNGRFLAIDTTSKKFYLGESSTEAVEKARAEHPDTVFYVVKIGSSVAETLAKLGAA